MTDIDESVQIHELRDFWEESKGEPLSLFENEAPTLQTGTYVIEPGERVPETGMTSHEGPEISVILSGEIVLGTSDEEYEVSAGSLTIIPAGIEHYSENQTDRDVELVYTVVGEL